MGTNRSVFCLIYRERCDHGIRDLRCRESAGREEAAARVVKRERRRRRHHTSLPPPLPHPVQITPWVSTALHSRHCTVDTTEYRAEKSVVYSIRGEQNKNLPLAALLTCFMFSSRLQKISVLLSTPAPAVILLRPLSVEVIIRMPRPTATDCGLQTFRGPHAHTPPKVHGITWRVKAFRDPSADVWRLLPRNRPIREKVQYGALCTI